MLIPKINHILLKGQSSYINPRHDHYQHYHHLHASLTNHLWLVDSFQRHSIHMCGRLVCILSARHRFASLATNNG